MAILITEAALEVGYPSALDYLLGALRMHLGDVTSPYQFSDGFLRKSLVDAFKSLDKRWQRRYDIVPSGTLESGISVVSGIDYNYYGIARTMDYVFTDVEPPVIQVEDERPIVLMAAIVIKRGLLQKNALDFGSWRDDEISFSNIEGGKALQESLKLDVSELESILPSRARKLARASKQSLPGFLYPPNIYEG
jgi:hypothetical protein